MARGFSFTPVGLSEFNQLTATRQAFERDRTQGIKNAFNDISLGLINRDIRKKYADPTSIEALTELSQRTAQIDPVASQRYGDLVSSAVQKRQLDAEQEALLGTQKSLLLSLLGPEEEVPTGDEVSTEFVETGGVEATDATDPKVKSFADVVRDRKPIQMYKPFGKDARMVGEGAVEETVEELKETPKASIGEKRQRRKETPPPTRRERVKKLFGIQANGLTQSQTDYVRTLLANRPSARNQELVQQTMQRYREQNETDVGRKVTALEQENRKFRDTNPLGKVRAATAQLNNLDEEIKKVEILARETDDNQKLLNRYGGGASGFLVQFYTDSQLGQELQDFLTPSQIKGRLGIANTLNQITQKSLRATLGAQFTEKENILFLKRGFNPAQSTQENLARMKRLAQELRAMNSVQVEMYEHFERGGSVEDFSPAGVDPEVVDIITRLGRSTDAQGRGVTDSDTRLEFMNLVLNRSGTGEISSEEHSKALLDEAALREDDENFYKSLDAG